MWERIAAAVSRPMFAPVRWRVAFAPVGWGVAAVLSGLVVFAL